VSVPEWWPVRAAEQVVPVADGRRPEIDPLMFGPPDAVRRVVKVALENAWEVWTAVMVDAGTKGRPKALVVAYRGPETVVASWEQDANMTWKPKGGTHWVGRRPGTRGEPSWTVLYEGVIKTAAPVA
jgi:hypothetical protein